jgi:anti-anti-sigma factor
MGVKVEKLGKASIVTVDGVVDEKMARDLRSQLQKISEAETVYVIFDMSLTQFLSSTGMGLIVAFANEHQKKYGTGSVVLAGLSDHIKRTMDVLGLLDLFIVVPDREKALKLCSSDDDKKKK